MNSEGTIYDLPIWNSSLKLESPDGKYSAEIREAHEISMGNPTSGTLELSTGLVIERCNPSFIWSDDSRYLAVPEYSFNRFWGVGRQKLTVIDVRDNIVWRTRKLAHYIQPKKFSDGLLTVLLNPQHRTRSVTFSIPADLDKEFKNSEAQ